MTGLQVLAVFAGLALLAVLNIWQLADFTGQEPRLAVSASQEPRVRGPVRPPQIQRMPGEMQLWYDRWINRTKDVSVFVRGQTAFGWVTGYLDEDLAKSTALAWCMQGADDCRVVEVRNELSQLEGLDVQVTERAKTLFTRFQMTSGPVAFAVSGSGAYASRKGDTADQARANAMLACTQFATKDRKTFLPANPCRVIAER